MTAAPRAVPDGPPSSAIGVDVGGTKIAAGLVAFPGGEVLERRRVPTGAQRGGEAILEAVLGLGQELATAARARSLPARAIGVGVCELVDLSGRVVSENCVAWKGLPVRERLSSLAPAIIEADVRAAALAEALFGAGLPFSTFIYVTVGTGISSCFVLDGKPFAGARGLAGTVASSPLPALDAGGAGRSPTLEEIASGPALLTRYNERSRSRLASGEEVVAAAAAGDTVAIEVVRSAAEALGAGVGWLVNTLDPEAVVVGGGLGLSGGSHWDTFVSSARRHVWSDVHRELPILGASNGSEAGVIGAAAAAWLACA